MSVLARFFALGALLYALKLAWPAAEPVRVTGADLEHLRAEWAHEARRPPTAKELEAQVNAFADEERLFREALRLGLDRKDAVVRTRLIRNMRFLDENTAADDPALLAQAYALGMPLRDVLVRRRLVQAMQQHFSDGVALSDAEVRDYVSAHAERYGAPRRVSFRHVFLDHGREHDLSVRPAQGDPFLLGAEFHAQSEADVARMFGATFARAVMALPAGEWSAPIESPYGDHFVRVEAIEPARAPEFETVRRQAYYALLEERGREAIEQGLRPLRRRYPVEVEHEAVALAGAR